MILSFDVGVRNLAYCRVEGAREGGQVVICDWDVLDLGEASCMSMTGALDAIEDLLDGVSTVLIEKQVRQNPKMLRMSAMLEMYLHARSLWNMMHVLTIRLVPAYHRTGVEPRRTKQSSYLRYKERKQRSVERAGELTKGTPWNAFLLRHKKKDDLADALCQAMLYVR